MGTEAAGSIGQGSSGVGSKTSTSADVASGMLAQHRTRGALDTQALAADVKAKTEGDPAARTALSAQVEAKITSPVDAGQFRAAMQAQNDNPSEEGVGAFFEGLVKGDYSENKSWSATAGQVVGGFIPIVGQIGDARDTVHALGDVIQGKDGAWGNLGLAAVGWVPGLGDAAKGAIRGGKKAVEAGTEIAPKLARKADDVAAAARPRIEIDGGSKGNWSKELNARDLKPNADYIANGYTYKTDANGRVTDVAGKLELKTAERNSYQQGVSGREDRLPDDQGGHLIASIFNGPGDRLNMVPMNGNFNVGAWRDMERTLQDALKANKSVEVKIEVKYPAGSQRPESFRVTHVIDGVPETEMFKNVAGGK